jgi:hypothetical protein
MSEGASAKAPNRIKFASAVANVPPGAIKNVRLKLTKKGKDILKKKRKRLNGVLEIRGLGRTVISNTPITIRLR